MISYARSIFAIIGFAGAIISSTSAFAQTSSCGTLLPCLQVTNTATTGGESIVGKANGTSGIAVSGEAFGDGSIGVVGSSPGYRGVIGLLTTTTEPALDPTLAAAVVGENRLSGSQFGVLGLVPGNGTGVAVYGDAQNGASSWGGYFNGIVGAHNSIFTDQNVYAMGVLLTSDARLKTNVVASKMGLAAVLRLRPVEYSWKSASADQGRHTGLIAQEVQKVLPDLVKTRKSPPLHTSPELQGTLAVDYIGLIPVMIKAIQEQQETIRKQDARIATLEQEQKTLAETASHKTMVTVFPTSDVHPAPERLAIRPIAAR